MMRFLDIRRFLYLFSRTCHHIRQRKKLKLNFSFCGNKITCVLLSVLFKCSDKSDLSSDRQSSTLKEHRECCSWEREVPFGGVKRYEGMRAESDMLADLITNPQIQGYFISEPFSSGQTNDIDMGIFIELVVCYWFQHGCLYWNQQEAPWNQ